MKFKILVTIVLAGTFASQAQNIFGSVCRGNISQLDSLLQHHSINVQDNRGRSLLHWAIGCKQKKVFDHLIQKGINPNLEDHHNRTPMYAAVQFDNAYYFEALRNLQEDNSWVQTQGTTLLERAILNRSNTFVQKLVAAGVNVNGKNERGSTPLEIAKRLEADDIYTKLLALGADEKELRTFVVKGPYMGQQPPDSIPKLFAPNFISTEESEFGSIFNSAGTEFYYAVDVNGKNEIRFSKLVDGVWSKPNTLLSHERYGYNDPFLSNDENRLYFISKQALDGLGKLKDVDIWYVEKEESGWSNPINAGPTINTKGNEYYISFTKDGTLYFSSNGHQPEKSDYDIYSSKFVNGSYQKPVRLGDAINTGGYEADVFVSPDESYMIFCSTRDGGFGQGDLYISFKNSNGKWTSAINMGVEINSKNYEYCPFVTKDGKYLFFTSNQDIYWVNTDVIAKLKGIGEQ